VRGSRRLRLTLVLLILTAFTLTALDNSAARTGPLAALRRGIDTVFGPVESVVGGGASALGRALGGIPRLGSYQSDNRRLQREIDGLNGRLAAQAGLQCQVDQLHQLMHLVDVTGFSTIPARVVAVGPAGGFEWTAVIDAGSADGVRPSQTVVTGAGLVGRTTEVSAHTAHVLLIADPEFTVGGSLAQVASIGFAHGNGSRPMTYSLASTRALVRKGDVLLTTGSDTYAAGVPIGTVTAVAPDANAISRTATVVPFVDVASLDLVGVITNAARTQPRGLLRPIGVGPSPTSSPCPAAVPQGPVPTSTPTPSPTPLVSLSPGASPGTSPGPSRSAGRSASPTPTRSP
jgi:rod shape-determining protein MreC